MSPHPLPDTVPADNSPRKVLRLTPALRAPAQAPAEQEAPELWLAAHLPGCAPRVPERLAGRAQRFTPRVCLAPPDGLLLEVKGSLHLFGGLEPLCAQVAGTLTHGGQVPLLAAAPVPRAALTAARAGQPLRVTTLARLTGQLAPLPLAALGWEPALLERLVNVGVRTIGQALRLPRAGFARRFGVAALRDLEQLVGREPDLRERHEVPAAFRRRRELLHEIEDHARLNAALAPLFTQLDQFLNAHQLAVLELTCLLWHRQGGPTVRPLRLAAPSGDTTRLATLLAERLAQQVFSAPVRACELRAPTLVPRQAPSDSLWQSGEHGGAPGTEGADLLERLTQRLGDMAVYGLSLAASHRPESAWNATDPVRPRRSPAGAPTLPQPPARRPAWLLRAPQRLTERQGRPWHHGPLRLVSEPERIETGWWDGAEVRRDYYIARDDSGVRLWIFREHAPPRGWYLHGVFA